MTTEPVAIVGPGRMGQGLALALRARDHRVELVGRTARAVAPGLRVHTGSWAEATGMAATIIVAVPDDAIAAAAERLAAERAVAAHQVVLHLSGLLDRGALSALAPTGAALGSLHPLQTIAEPGMAAARLAGAYAGVEGDDRAVERAETLARVLDMKPVRLPAGAKPAYHAAAAIVANYSAVLLRLAEQVARRAGVPDSDGGRIYGPLLQGAAANLAELGPVAALTGPIRRGDVRTIKTHLGVLDAEERALYRRLGAVALELAREAGLPDPAAEAVAGVLSADR